MTVCVFVWTCAHPSCKGIPLWALPGLGCRVWVSRRHQKAWGKKGVGSTPCLTVCLCECPHLRPWCLFLVQQHHVCPYTLSVCVSARIHVPGVCSLSNSFMFVHICCFMHLEMQSEGHGLSLRLAVCLSVCVSACQNGAPSLVACEVMEQEACGLDPCLKICGLLCLDDIKCNEATRIHRNGCLCVPQCVSADMHVSCVWTANLWHMCVHTR